MKSISSVILVILFIFSNHYSALAQGGTQNPAFGQEIEKMLEHGVATLTIKDFKKMLSNENVVILDAREKHEYEVSHIKDAKWLGHNSLNTAVLEKIDKNATIVVYCTVGVRADKVGARLQKMGFQNVYNLFGSIVEWVNQGNSVVDASNQPTKKVHTYREEYAKWLTAGTKVLD
jgi:rhodanese-related sulfurtransferase